MERRERLVEKRKLKESLAEAADPQTGDGGPIVAPDNGAGRCGPRDRLWDPLLIRSTHAPHPA